MRKITNIERTEMTNPKLRQVATYLSDEVGLAMEKALANYADPSVYPISDDSKSLEQICRTYFLSIKKPEKQQAMAQKVMLSINAPMEQRRQQYGDLAEIDLRSKTSIEEQAQSLVPLELQITEDDLRGRNGHPPPHGSHHVSHESERSVRPSEVSGTATQQLSRLVFRICKVECKEQTGELGEDEIFLGGTAIDERGNVQKIDQFKAGDFEKGDVWTTPPQPRPFGSFELRKPGIGYPRTYSVLLVLVEEDAGNLTDILNRRANFVRDKLKEKITEEAIKNWGLFGIIVGEVLGFVVDKVFEIFGRWWGDEIFQPVDNLVSLPSSDFRWDDNTKSMTSSLILWEFTGFGGRYWVDCDWELFTAQGVVV